MRWFSRQRGLAVALALVCTTSGHAGRGVRNLIAKGNICYRRLDCVGALKLYDWAIKWDSTNSVAHGNRGLALHKLGRLADSVKALRRSVALDAKKPELYLNLGKVLACSGQMDEAEGVLRKALALRPGYGEAVYNLVWVLDEKGDHRGAAALAGQMLVSPALPGTRMLAGVVAFRGGDRIKLAAACFDFENLRDRWRWVTDLNRCLLTGGIRGYSPDGRVSLLEGLSCLSRERFAEARALLERAAKLDPASPVPLWSIAMGQVAAGRAGFAGTAMTKAGPLMTVLRLPVAAGGMQYFVDTRAVGAGPIEMRVLPGAHLIELGNAGP